MHLIAHELFDLSALLHTVGDRALPLPHTPGDEFRTGDPGPRPERITVKARDFR